MINQNRIQMYFFGLLAWLCTGCAAFPRDLVYQDETVRIYNGVSIVPHGTEANTLVVKGKSFAHLYSYRYVLIPEWNSIVFVTHREGGKYKVHIFDLNGGGDTIIERDQPFGSKLGRAEEAFLQSVAADTAIFVEKMFKGPDAVYRLNRATKTMQVAN
jgi:hypothetical protein